MIEVKDLFENIRKAMVEFLCCNENFFMLHEMISGTRCRVNGCLSYHNLRKSEKSKKLEREATIQEIKNYLLMVERVNCIFSRIGSDDFIAMAYELVRAHDAASENPSNSDSRQDLEEKLADVVIETVEAGAQEIIDKQMARIVVYPSLS